MKRFLDFVKTVLVKPTWLLITFAWGIFSNVPTFISLFEFLTKRDFTQYKDIFVQSPFFSFLSLYWIPILIGVYLLVIVKNLYQIALPHLGDTINADLNIELFPRQKEGYASIKILNNEFDDLLEPELSYCELDILEDGHLIPKLNNINGNAANISWALGGQERIIRGKKQAVFNLAKQQMVNFFFLLDDGSSPRVETGIYKAVIVLQRKVRRESCKLS